MLLFVPGTDGRYSAEVLIDGLRPGLGCSDQQKIDGRVRWFYHLDALFLREGSRNSSLNGSFPDEFWLGAAGEPLIYLIDLYHDGRERVFSIHQRGTANPRRVEVRPGGRKALGHCVR